MQPDLLHLALHKLPDVGIVGHSGELQKMALQMVVGHQTLCALQIVTIADGTAMPWQSHRNHAASAWFTDTVAQITQHFLSVDAEVDGLSQGARTVGTQRVVGVDEEGEILGVQVRLSNQLDFVLILFAQVAVVGQQLVLIARVDARHEIKLALDELQKSHLLVNEEADGNSIDIGQPLPCRIALKVVGILAEDELHAFFPILEVERTCPHGMATEVVAIILNGFVRYH